MGTVSLSSFSHARVTTVEFMSAFWPLVTALIPESVAKPLYCEEILALGLNLLKNLPDTSVEHVDLARLVGEWGELLLNHESREVRVGPDINRRSLTTSQTIGHPESIDVTVHGLANLLYQATSLAQVWQRPLDCGYDCALPYYACI